MDSTEGTSLSLEHASLSCLQSTAAVGGVLKSRIIGDMTAHSTVTSPRQAAVIITEYGSADLRGRTVRERAAALTAIAHPQFRDELTATAELLGR
jgi:acyl-CoA hydrolase